MTADPIKECPECHKLNVRRLIGAGAGLIFKGSGFYITDYRSKGYNDSKKADAPKTESKSSDSSSSSSASSSSSTSSGSASSSGGSGGDA